MLQARISHITHGRCLPEVTVSCWAGVSVACRDVVPANSGCLVPGLTHGGASLELNLGDFNSGQDRATEKDLPSGLKHPRSGQDICNNSFQDNGHEAMKDSGYSETGKKGDEPYNHPGSWLGCRQGPRWSLVGSWGDKVELRVQGGDKGEWGQQNRRPEKAKLHRMRTPECLRGPPSEIQLRVDQCMHVRL